MRLIKKLKPPSPIVPMIFVVTIVGIIVFGKASWWLAVPISVAIWAIVSLQNQTNRIDLRPKANPTESNS